MDHGEMDHLIFVYREVIQVPLILKLPASSRSGERVETNVQLVDVLPTVVSFLGLPPLPAAVGANLLELPSGPPRQIVSESVYPRIHFGWSDLSSIVEDDLHFIDSPEPELFRLSVDPQERSNVIQEERAVARRLRGALAGVERTLTPPTEEDPETMERLRSLGYLSGGVGDEDLTLADPKDRIGLVGELARITRLIARGELVEAEPALNAVLEQEPGMVDVWQQLGDVLERLRRPRAALEAYRTAFRVSRGERASAGLKVAELLLRRGRVTEAREHALAVVDRTPMAHDVLAQAAMLSNDLEAAEGHLDRAIEARGHHVTPLITRLAWLNRSGRFEQTVVSSEEVLREFGERQDREVLAHLYLYRGTALAALSRGAEAARDYRQAIQLRPGLLGAYSSLAFLHAVEGRVAETGRVLQELVTVNPNPAGYVEAVRTLRLMNDQRSADAVLREARDRWPDAEELQQIESRL